MDLARLEAQAAKRLGDATYGFLAGGSGEELTVADNLAAWSRLRLRPRVLRDVGEVRTATTVLGEDVATPVLVAPVGFQRLAHPGAELATAQAAGEVGTVMTISTRASERLEAIVAAGAPCWLQVYIVRDRGLTADLVQRGAAAGCHALVLTADAPYVGSKPRYVDSGFVLAPGEGAVNLGAGDLTHDPGAQQDPGATFDDIGWLANLVGLPVLVKGVLRADDATACLDAGAAGVIVSNHGGRQLDGAVATAAVLHDIASVVGDSGEVLVDGGIRRGSDVVKALALGARAVMIGRPILWGLADGGADGVRNVLRALTDELIEAMALCGASALADLTPDLIADVAASGRSGQSDQHGPAPPA